MPCIARDRLRGNALFYGSAATNSTSGTGPSGQFRAAEAGPGPGGVEARSKGRTPGRPVVRCVERARGRCGGPGLRPIRGRGAGPRPEPAGSGRSKRGGGSCPVRGEDGVEGVRAVHHEAGGSFGAKRKPRWRAVVRAMSSMVVGVADGRASGAHAARIPVEAASRGQWLAPSTIQWPRFQASSRSGPASCPATGQMPRAVSSPPPDGFPSHSPGAGPDRRSARQNDQSPPGNSRQPGRSASSCGYPGSGADEARSEDRACRGPGPPPGRRTEPEATVAAHPSRSACPRES